MATATKKNVGYKVFFRDKDGKLYPPMVPNKDRKPTPVGVWIKANTPPPSDKEEVDRKFAHLPQWLRRYQVSSGGKGTHTSTGKLAYRPGWHLSNVPYATQFNKLNPKTGKKDLFPKEFVWAECEYESNPEKDRKYQAECYARMFHDYDGKCLKGMKHAMGGLNHLPTGGHYRYRTNIDPNSVEWIITGAIKVNKILTKAEVDRLVKAAGKTPQKVG